MKANIVVKGLAVLVVAVVVVLLTKANLSDSDQSPSGPVMTATDGLSEIESGPDQVDNGLTIDLLDEQYLEEEFGVDTDTPVETMRTLTKETRAVREDSVRLQEENKRLKDDISRLLKMEENLKGRIENRFENAERDAETKQRELEHTQNMTQSLISRLESRLEQLRGEETQSQSASQKSADGYDIHAAGIPSGLGYDNSGAPVDYDQVVWTNPLEAKMDPANPNKISLPDFALDPEALPAPAAGAIDRASELTKDKSSIRAYTIPDNATLLGSVSMTALLGRIPINGQVVDPYPFKVMIGEENLSSNGIQIPGLVGIKMSGIAKGDWTLSCVSGQIQSMTFTFDDGTLVTYPEPGTQEAEGIAWFSDKYGIPCVTGKRITNAPSYLAQRIGLSAASSYSQARADSEFTTSTNGFGGVTSGLTGSPETVAKNEAIASGLDEATDWLDERQSNSFDAIYVDPGTEIVVHVTKQIAIDYDPDGRKVNHYAQFDRRTEHHLD